MVRVSGLNASLVSGRFWCAAILTAASAIGVATSADAALYDLQDPDPGFYRPGPPIQPRRQKVRLPSGKKAIEKESAAKPQGPLVIAVSIGRQQVKIYDTNGLFAEAPVSTGMPGHSTPMGAQRIQHFPDADYFRRQHRGFPGDGTCREICRRFLRRDSRALRCQLWPLYAVG